MKTAIAGLKTKGYGEMGPPEAALVHAGFGDEGYVRFFLVSTTLEMASGKFDRSVQTVSAIVQIDAMTKSVRVVDAVKVWSALRTLMSGGSCP